MPIKVPTDHFLSAIQEKKVYYFSSIFLKTTEPHYFICIKRTEDEVLILTCCTSQRDTIQKFIEKKNLPFETMVWISPSDRENPFYTDTYVNCNSTFTYTVDEFRSMYDSDKIDFSGEISLNYYSQIITGIHKSPLVEAETKELIPQLEEL
jgi:hypothetical protein